MREVDNKIGFGNVQQPRVDSKPKAEEINAPQEAEEVQKSTTKDLNSGAAVGGRSQVAEADALKKDINFLLAHPKVVQSASNYFDMKYNSLIAEGKSPQDAYIEASQQMDIYAGEFVKA